MSANFRVDFGKFFYPPPAREFPSVVSRQETLKRKESSRFAHHEACQKGMQAYEENGKSKIKLLEVIQKVISVFSALLSILMPLAIFYLPSWVPWGISLPLILLSIYAQGKIHESIQKNKMDAEFIPSFHEMVGQHSYRSLHPIGPHDLPKQDPRLKSDKMMRHEVDKPVRRSAQRIEEVIGYRSRKNFQKYDLPDLEMTSYVQQTAASAFSGGVPLKQFRKTLKTVREAAVCQEKESCDSFQVRMIDQKRAAYGSDQILLFPQSKRIEGHSFRDKAHSLVLLYDAFGKQFEQAKSSYQEWQQIYSVLCPTEEKAVFLPWNAFETLAGNLKKEITPLLELFYKESSPEEFQQLLNEIKNKHVEPFLYFLIDQSKKIKQKLDKKIEDHPFKKHEAIRKQLLTFLEKDSLSQSERLALTAWMKSHPEGSKKKILKIPRKSFPKELKEWLQRHPDSHNLTAHELLERTDKIKKGVVAALEKFYFIPQSDDVDPQQYQIAIQSFLIHFSKLKNFEKKLTRLIKKEDPFSVKDQMLSLSKSPYYPKKEIEAWLKQHQADSKLSPKELLEEIVSQKEQALRDFEAIFQFVPSPKLTYTILNEKLDHFKKESFVPLKRLVERGGLSDVSDYLKLLFFKIPAQPFKTGNPFSKKNNPKLYKTQPYFSKRRVTEIQLDRKLKAVDQKMLAVNQARVWALRAPTYLLFAIEGIVSLYFSSPWIFWGFSALSVLAEGASYYVNERLKLMEKKKEAIKLQYQLRNRPNIDFMPGNRPGLKRLKEVQQKYDLDGVAPTWSRVLAEGDDFLKTPSRKEALKMAKKGSKKAGRYLDQTLISLKSELIGVEAPFKKMQLQTKIDYLEQGSGSAQARQFLEDRKKCLEIDLALDPKPKKRERLVQRIAYIESAGQEVKKPTEEQLNQQQKIKEEAKSAQAVHAYSELYANEKIKYKTWIDDLQNEIQLFEVSEKVLKKELGNNWNDLFSFNWIESRFVVHDQEACLLKAAEGERAQLIEGATFNLIDAIKYGRIELLRTLEKERLLKIAHHMAHLRRMINFYGSKEAIVQRTLKYFFYEIDLEVRFQWLMQSPLKAVSEEEQKIIAWKKREIAITTVFLKLPYDLQQEFYENLPEPFFNQFRPFIEVYSAFYQKLPKLMDNQKLFENHWKVNQRAVQEAFDQIDPNYHAAILCQLPDFFKNRIRSKRSKSRGKIRI